MSSHPLPAHAEVQTEIQSLQLSVDASELHGSLCGLLCGAAPPPRGQWLQRLALEPGSGGQPREDGPLDRLYLASAGQLEDPELGFELLLPDDARPVEQRGDALLGWCRGFLGGFGLSAGPRPPLSPEAGEALEDLARIAATDLSYEEAEADESALAEVSEFVRIAALLLHGDCVHGPSAPRKLH